MNRAATIRGLAPPLDSYAQCPWLPAASREFELLVLIARRELTGRRRLRELAVAELDWDRVFQLATCHGLLPLLGLHLQAECAHLLPPEVVAQARSKFTHNAQHNLRLTSELFRVLDLLAENGITAVPFKGPALGTAAFGDLALRQSSDIDLLLRRADVLRAKDLLRALGYAPHYRLSARQEQALLRCDCEYVLLGPGELCLELHWDVAPRYAGLPVLTESAWQNLAPVQMAGRTVHSLSAERMVWALCVHAAKHVWKRMGWITDIAEFVRRHPQLNWPEVRQQAQKAGGERVLHLSLYLAHALVPYEVPREVALAINSDAAVPQLAACIAQEFWQTGSDPEARGLTKYRFFLRARERWTNQLAYALRAAFTPTLAEFSAVSLPGGLQWLYPVVRGCRLLAKYGRPALV